MILKRMIGDIVDDKYTAFKKWLKDSEYYFHSGSICAYFPIEDIFDQFEKEYYEQKKENEIKKLIYEGVMEQAIKHNSFGDWVNNVYNKLKENGFLKI